MYYEVKPSYVAYKMWTSNLCSHSARNFVKTGWSKDSHKYLGLRSNLLVPSSMMMNRQC